MIHSIGTVSIVCFGLTLLVSPTDALFTIQFHAHSVVAPVNSQLLFTITDAYGEVITSEDAIIVKSNNLGMARDSWCQYVYNNTPIPTAATNGSHRYSWNATSGQDDDDGDGAVENGTSSSDGVTSGGTATSTFASKVTATNSVDTNATDMNDKSTTM